MGYLVLIHTKDMRQAKKAIASHEDGDLGTAVGLYYLPARDLNVCPGADCPHAGKRLNGWKRDEQYGRIVHACGRPHREWRKRIAMTLTDLFGYNLYTKAPGLFKSKR